MADRTSANLFGTIFQLLSDNPTEEHKQIASSIYKLRGYYDFSTYQMYADDALIALDLAKMGEDGEIIYEE